MLWKKNWAPEAVLALIGGIVAVFFTGGVALGLLRQAGVAGFASEVSTGSVLLGTMTFQGAVIVLGTVFLKFHDSGWREALGGTNWPAGLGLAAGLLVLMTPLMFGLKYASELALHKLHFQVEDQLAVKMVLDARPWVRVYLVFFAVVIAPLGEEFFFRGLLFSTAKRFGRPRLGWVGVSLLFALIHWNAPTFLPLFVLALGLTWLYEKTEGLLAPVIAHSLFNTANLVLLCLQTQ
jgi:membrane protease YdiL (CAAX protease family)